MATLDGIYYDELKDSPTFAAGRDGPTAQRKFRVAWTSVDAFLANMFPAAVNTGKGWIFPVSAAFPGKTWMSAQQYKVDPWDGDKTTGYDSNGVRAYEWAVITVDYKAPEYDPSKKDPAEQGDQILADHSLAFSAEMLKLGIAGWAWDSDKEKIKNEEASLAKVCSQIEHTLTWNYVPYPPFTTISQTVGCVNSDEKLFYAKIETLLFIGAEINRSYHSQTGDEAWKVRYKFLQRCIKDSTKTVGWNHIWRSDTAPGGSLWTGWDKPVKSDGSFIYSAVKFADLFKSDGSNDTK